MINADLHHMQFVSAVKVQNEVEDCRISVKVDLVLIQRVSLRQL